MFANNSLISPTASVAGNASSNSKNVWADSIARASFQVATLGTGVINGTFQLQGSNDQAVGAPAGQFNPINWTNIGPASTVNVATPTAVYLLAAAAGLQNIETSYEYMRVVFTDASSGAATGTFSIRMKSIGF